MENERGGVHAGNFIASCWQKKTGGRLLSAPEGKVGNGQPPVFFCQQDAIKLPA
jgi:hypothetical protein